MDLRPLTLHHFGSKLHGKNSVMYLCVFHRPLPVGAVLGGQPKCVEREEHRTAFSLVRPRR